ncbi:MAG: glycosyltransferase family 39 protein [Chloroflexota bacterium]
MRQREDANWAPAAVLLAAATGFALRWRAFGSAELGLDGHLAVGLALAPLGDMLAFNLRDVHPPLFYLLLGGWLQAAGIDFTSARWPAVAAGTLTIPLLYQLGRRLLGPWPGLAATLLLALSPAHIFLSATVRDFGLGLGLSTLTLVLLLALARPEQSGRRAAALALALGLATGAALLTWYFHLLYLGLAALYLLLHRRPGGRLAAWALGAGTLLALPWYAVALPVLAGKAARGVTVSGEGQSALALDAFARGAAEGLVGSADLPWPVLLLGWTAATLAGLALWWRAGRSRAALASVVAGLALGLLGAYVLAERWVQSTFIARYLLIPLPFALLAQAALLSGRDWRQRSLGVLALIVLLLPAGNWYWDLSRSGSIPYDADPALRYLEPRLAPGDAVIFMDYARAGLYRLRAGEAPCYVIHFAGSAFLADDVPARAATLAPAILARHRRVWFVLSQEDRQGEAEVVRRALGPPLAEPTVVRYEWWWAQVSLHQGQAAG